MSVPKYRLFLLDLDNVYLYKTFKTIKNTHCFFKICLNLQHHSRAALGEGCEHKYCTSEETLLNSPRFPHPRLQALWKWTCFCNLDQHSQKATDCCRTLGNVRLKELRLLLQCTHRSCFEGQVWHVPNSGSVCWSVFS